MISSFENAVVGDVLEGNQIIFSDRNLFILERCMQERIHSSFWGTYVSLDLLSEKLYSLEDNRSIFIQISRDFVPEETHRRLIITLQCRERGTILLMTMNMEQNVNAEPRGGMYERMIRPKDLRVYFCFGISAYDR